MSRRDPTTVEKIRGLPWINAYSSLNSAFCQLTVFGSVFILFLNDLGLRKTQIGMLLALMPLCSMLSLLTAPYVARFGFRRSFLLFWGARSIVILPLLLTPWYVTRFGTGSTFVFIAVILLMFSLCRSIGETAWYPWSHEVIPPYIRGKFSAVNGMLQTTLSMSAVLMAGWVLGLGTGLWRYLWLIGGGVVIGLTSVAAMSFVPGGAPPSAGTADKFSFRRFLPAIRDRNFLLYLAGVGLVMLGGSLMAFVPLYMRESIGLRESQVVFVQGSGMIGVLASSYLWGWAADRYGSKPVMLLGLAATVVMPILWFLLPRHSSWSMLLAVGVGAAGGLASLGYGIGSARQLYTDVVPQEGRTAYFSLYCAWCGLMAGLGAPLAGQVLQASAGLGGSLGWLSFDAYSPLFAGSVLMLGGGMLILSRTRSDSRLSTAEFAGMFLRGNPLRAMATKVRYSMALDESDRATLTRQLSGSGSPLSADELIEALYDPSFNVRQEAIFAIAQSRPDFRLIEAMWRVAEGDHPDGQAASLALPAVGRVSRRRSVRQLIESLRDGNFNTRYEAVVGLSRVRPEPAVMDALVRVVEEPESDLAIVAVWALSRLGGPQAIAASRKALTSDRPLLAARAARALGTLHDLESVPVLLERFRTLRDPSLRLAYASALGAMRVAEPAAEMVRLLPALREEVSRAELVLALVRIIGGERDFTRLWRMARRDAGTGLSQVMISCRKRLRRMAYASPQLLPILDACIDSLARDDLPAASSHLRLALTMLPTAKPGSALPALIEGCVGLLQPGNPALREGIVLGVHVFSESLNGVDRTVPVSAGKASPTFLV
ncbi:MAG: MFS transporter [Phycisphaerae bacterium]